MLLGISQVWRSFNPLPRNLHWHSLKMLARASSGFFQSAPAEPPLAQLNKSRARRKTRRSFQSAPAEPLLALRYLHPRSSFRRHLAFNPLPRNLYWHESFGKKLWRLANTFNPLPRNLYWHRAEELIDIYAPLILSIRSRGTSIGTSRMRLICARMMSCFQSAPAEPLLALYLDHHQAYPDTKLSIRSRGTSIGTSGGARHRHRCRRSFNPLPRNLYWHTAFFRT